MDCGNIEIEKIESLDSFTEYVLNNDWLYSNAEKDNFNKARGEAFKNRVDIYENKKKNTVLNEIDLTKECINENKKLNLFSTRAYRAVMSGSAYCENEKIPCEALGRICGQIDALLYFSSICEKLNTKTKCRKIKWTGKQTELITIFYEMQEFGLLECNKVDLYRLINQNFIDKDNEEITQSYIERLFRPGNKERSKKRVDFKELL